MTTTRKTKSKAKYNNIAIDSATNAELDFICDEKGWSKVEAMRRLISEKATAIRDELEQHQQYSPKP